MTEEEEREREEALEREEQEKRRINELIEKNYGKDGVKTIETRTLFTARPITLSSEELDDDTIVEAMENTPVFKRGDNFNPYDYKPEVKKQDLFN
jgi:cell division protein FtsZ